jgi:transcription antitermination factor NusG
VGYGATEKSGLIHSKLLANNIVSAQIAHLLLPTRNVMGNPTNGAAVVAQRLFPGYFLLGVTCDNPTWWEMQIEVEEIYRILTLTADFNFSGDMRIVAFLNDQEKEHIIEMIREIPHTKSSEGFVVGERVTVKKGAFQGLFGEILEIRGKTHAKVAIELRSRLIPAIISLFHLEPRKNNKDKRKNS